MQGGSGETGEAADAEGFPVSRYGWSDGNSGLGQRERKHLGRGAHRVYVPLAMYIFCEIITSKVPDAALSIA